VLPLNVIGTASNEDGGKGEPHIDQVLVKLHSGHLGHVNVSDQACGFGETSGGQESGRRNEIFDSITQRRDEPPYGRAKELIIVNNRNK
jgi:hypothetical protein